MRLYHGDRAIVKRESQLRVNGSNQHRAAECVCERIQLAMPQRAVGVMLIA